MEQRKSDLPLRLAVGLTLLGAIFVGMIYFGAPTPDGPLPAPSPMPRPQDTKAEQLVAAHNHQRKQHDIGPLTLEPSLARAAQAHAEECARRGVLSHEGQDGSSPPARARRAGYASGYVGENIAMGYPSVESVVQGWMRSAGHRQNILNTHYSDVGFGYADSSKGAYWVALFGGTPTGDMPEPELADVLIMEE
jgi:uncharacterized protein YkwD